MNETKMTSADAANLAIFHQQLHTHRAVRFVATRAKVDYDKAVKAVKHAMTGYQTAS